MTKVVPGADKLVSSKLLVPDGSRVGLVVNPASVTSRFVHVADALLARKEITVSALFGPEHGMFATAQDMVGVSSQIYQGVRVYSLYGQDEKSLSPPERVVKNLDLLIFDLQDVGSRYYTFIWTMLACMKVCAGAGTRFLVCDRPNPIGGQTVEGPLLNMKFSSFVGKYPMCIRHGMTIGEIALYLNDELDLGCRLEVIPIKGYRREMWMDDTALPWIMPSPNMPTLDTATVYPGGCLIEGTNLSEGRGTTRPFELVGAPYLHAPKLAESLNELGLPGVHFRPVNFEPMFHKFAHQPCSGVFVHVTNRARFLPVKSYLALIIEARRQAPEQFAWRDQPYEFESDVLAIDLLFGDDTARRAIEAGADAAEITKSWAAGLRNFKKRRARHLIYK